MRGNEHMKYCLCDTPIGCMMCAIRLPNWRKVQSRSLLLDVSNRSSRKFRVKKSRASIYDFL